MTTSHSNDIQSVKCCTSDETLAWSSALAEAALEGEAEPAHVAEAVSHWLQIRAAEL
jgi:hypothetical protein